MAPREIVGRRTDENPSFGPRSARPGPRSNSQQARATSQTHFYLNNTYGNGSAQIASNAPISPENQFLVEAVNPRANQSTDTWHRPGLTSTRLTAPNQQVRSSSALLVYGRWILNQRMESSGTLYTPFRRSTHVSPSFEANQPPGANHLSSLTTVRSASGFQFPRAFSSNEMSLPSLSTLDLSELLEPLPWTMHSELGMNRPLGNPSIPLLSSCRPIQPSAFGGFGQTTSRYDGNSHRTSYPLLQSEENQTVSRRPKRGAKINEVNTVRYPPVMGLLEYPKPAEGKFPVPTEARDGQGNIITGALSYPIKDFRDESGRLIVPRRLRPRDLTPENTNIWKASSPYVTHKDFIVRAYDDLTPVEMRNEDTRLSTNHNRWRAVHGGLSSGLGGRAGSDSKTDLLVIDRLSEEQLGYGFVWQKLPDCRAMIQPGWPDRAYPIPKFGPSERVQTLRRKLEKLKEEATKVGMDWASYHAEINSRRIRQRRRAKAAAEAKQEDEDEE